MSAYVVERNHIRFLVTAAERLSRSTFSWWSAARGKRMHLGLDVDADGLGQMLWDENVRSVAARYPDCQRADGSVKHDRLPGTAGEVYLYQHPKELGWHQIDPVAVLKACSCLAYQSCEHEGWKQSEARAVLDAIERAAINQLPGYDDAEWGVPGVDSNARPLASLLT